MLEYLVQAPKNISENHPLIILLHGYGSNMADLYGFAPELSDEAYVVSFQAPHSLGYGSYAWYAIHFEANSSDKFSDIAQAKQSMQLIKDSVAQLCKQLPVNPRDITLVGFSQGAILSYALGMSYPKIFSKIVALSGYFNADMCLEDYQTNNLSQLKIFASHGSEDQVIPVSWARNSKALLLQKNICVTYKEYPVGHGVAPQNFVDFKTWMLQNK